MSGRGRASRLLVVAVVAVVAVERLYSWTAFVNAPLVGRITTSRRAAEEASEGMSFQELRVNLQDFSREKLRAETEDPFAKPRIWVYGVGAISAGLGFLFILPRLLGAVFHAPNASPVASVATDLAINVAAFAFFAYLTSQEADSQAKQEQAKEEGALLARLEVWLTIPGAKAPVLAQLSDLRASRSENSRRAVLCMGNVDYCLSCVRAASALGEALDRTEFILVPALNDAASEADRLALQQEAESLSFVALPSKGSVDWATLCEQQAEQVRSQGMDEAQGQVIIIKKNGRVGTRFLGVPDFIVMTSEVDARVQSGMDTTNI